MYAIRKGRDERNCLLSLSGKNRIWEWTQQHESLLRWESLKQAPLTTRRTLGENREPKGGGEN